MSSQRAVLRSRARLAQAQGPPRARCPPPQERRRRHRAWRQAFPEFRLQVASEKRPARSRLPLMSPRLPRSQAPAPEAVWRRRRAWTKRQEPKPQSPRRQKRNASMQPSRTCGAKCGRRLTSTCRRQGYLPQTCGKTMPKRAPKRNNQADFGCLAKLTATFSGRWRANTRRSPERKALKGAQRQIRREAHKAALPGLIGVASSPSSRVRRLLPLSANSRKERARPDAPVAQLDRALPSEGKGHKFESCRVRHI